jgi:hypothetical protein
LITTNLEMHHTSRMASGYQKTIDIDSKNNQADWRSFGA